MGERELIYVSIIATVAGVQHICGRKITHPVLAHSPTHPKP